MKNVDVLLVLESGSRVLGVRAGASPPRWSQAPAQPHPGKAGTSISLLEKAFSSLSVFFSAP